MREQIIRERNLLEERKAEVRGEGGKEGKVGCGREKVGIGDVMSFNRFFIYRSAQQGIQPRATTLRLSARVTEGVPINNTHSLVRPPSGFKLPPADSARTSERIRDARRWRRALPNGPGA